MLLVLPVPFRAPPEGTLLVEQQAWNGLERWAENFDRMIVAAPVLPESALGGRSTRWVAAESLPSRARIDFVRLPWAYRPDHFVKAKPLGRGGDSPFTPTAWKTRWCAAR